MKFTCFKISLFISFSFLFFIYPLEKLKAQTCRYSSHHQGVVPQGQSFIPFDQLPFYYDRSGCEELVRQNKGIVIQDHIVLRKRVIQDHIILRNGNDQAE